MGMVFVPYSAWGHVAPVLPVIAELTGRGVPVTVVVGERYRGAVEAAGAVAAVPALDHDVRVPARYRPGDLVERGLLWRDRRRAWQATAATVAAELSRPETELCVVDPHIRWTAALAARHGVQAVPMWSSHARSALGDGPVLINTLPELQPRCPRLGPGARFVGPLRSPMPGADRGIDWARLGGRVLLVAPGTVFERSARFFHGITAAFADSEWTVVLATAQLPVDALGPLPGNVIAHRWIPQSTVLDRAEVFVTHAGINSVHDAVLAGVPMVLTPRIAEQRRTAARLRALGVGEPMAAGRRLRAQVERLSTDPATRRAVGALRERASAARGAARAAEILANLCAARAARLG